MNNKQVLSALLIAIMIISIAASTATCAGTGWTEEETWYTPIITTQTLPLLMFDSLPNSKPLSPTSSTTVTLTAVADATVKSWQPDSNFGSESVLSLSYSKIDVVSEAVTLLRFDLASEIPSNAIIDSATLELFLMDGTGADPVGVAAYFVTSSWAESSVTWNLFPTAEPIGVISQVDRSPGSYKSWQVTSFAQEWQSGLNDGVYLRGPVDGIYYERTFESREHNEGVPRLVVTYHLPSTAYTFTGNVYQGSPPETDTPAGDVTVELWGDEDEWPEAGFERVLLTSTATGDAGEFSLSWEAGDTYYPYLHVIEVDPPGTYSTGAQAGEPGNVTNFNVVSYLDIPPGTYGGIAFWDQMPEEKPDLIIINVWNENGTICYLIENIGAGVAPGGHCTALSVDGVYRVEDCVDEEIAPGAGMERCFEYAWEYSPPEDVVVVCADHRGVVEERDEENNCVERVVGCPPGEKPDLAITDLWNEEGTICYQIQNIGEGVAPGGHCTALIVDDEYRVCDPVDQELEPGNRLRGSFDYDRECTSPEDILVVVADYEDNVAEDDEENNQREEIWKCDVVPPQIIYGPIVQDVTEESAVIFWETDEDCDSVVKYGKASERYDLEEGGSAVVIEHSITLLRLEPSTTYNFVAQSTDASGNTVESNDITLETLPVPDDIDPTVSIVDPGVCQGIVTIEAEAEDNIGVEKVEFFIADELVFTDFLEEQSYRSPRLPLDTCDYENGNYTLKAKAYDLSGRFFMDKHVIEIVNFIDVTAPKVRIFNPPDGATVSGEYSVHVHVEDDSGWSDVEWFVDGKKIGGGKYPTSPKLDLSFWWDTRFLKDRRYTLAVKATDETKKTGLDTVDVYVSNVEPPYKPDLVIEKHEVTRHKNTFAIELTVKNQGKASASKIEIHDLLKTFQPISRSNFNFVDYESEYISSTNELKCVITDSMNLGPGDSRTYTYAAIPVLFHPKPPQPSIGHSIKLSYKGHSANKHEKTVTFTVFNTTKGVSLAKEYDEAIKEADYLIITNPGSLVSRNPFQRDDVDALLSDMAELAFDKQGVLGYFSVSDRNVLRNLMRPNGAWAKRLKDGFYKYKGNIGGYLLIVGETEIIPAWDLSVKPPGCTWCPSVVHDSDHNYADTYSGWPSDIIVGRIIGNQASNLSAVIDASIAGHGFDRSDALLVSGTGGGQDKFVKNVNDVGGILKGKKFTVDTLHWKDHPTDALQQFRNRTSNKDVIYFRDHGGIDCWCPSLRTHNFPVNFGNTDPFVFASCCQAGNYERGDDYNIAEAFFDSGAAVYIGSTEDSPRSLNNEAGKNFFNNWGADKTIGWAFTLTERVLTTNSDTEKWWRYWVAEYNLYGDPKFGVLSSKTTTALTAYVQSEPLSSIDVVVPNYEVNTTDGIDYAEIPGGHLLLLEGRPVIPFYTISIEYPQGYRVQNAALTERSGLVTDTGLDLPIASMKFDFPYETGESSSDTVENWLPEEDYRWELLENPDGTSTLIIVIYPFHYNPLTTDVRFYRNYSFDIDYIVSPVAITTLSTNRDGYEQDDRVIVDIELNNSGEPRDVIFSASVKRYGSDEVASGLLLRTLKDFTGPASFSPQWNSDGFEPGYYSVEVTLKDTSGNVLDRKTEMFRLGISSGEIASFTATPECFDIGDEIEIEMVFKNNGTVNITGTAVIRALNSTGDTAEEFRHNITNLTPSESVSFSDAWDTSGTEAGSLYKIVGHVLYDSKSSDPATVTVRNTIMGDLNRDGVVTTADAAIALELAAHGEYDPAADVDCDGRITSLDVMMILQAVAGNIELQGCES